MKILPVRGFRFRGEADVSHVVAPPYDQIGPETQAELYARSAWNIVRVSYPRDEPGGDKYARARATLDTWLADGVWVPEAAPAIYPYQQTYTAHGQSVTRTGFIALGEVNDYAEGGVLPHERTHAGPKRDRMQLLEATAADTGLLFMLVSDPDRAILAATAPTGEPIAEARDLKRELHRLCRITDDAAIAAIRRLRAPKPVLIA